VCGTTDIIHNHGGDEYFTYTKWKKC